MEHPNTSYRRACFTLSASNTPRTSSRQNPLVCYAVIPASLNCIERSLKSWRVDLSRFRCAHFQRGFSRDFAPIPCTCEAPLWFAASRCAESCRAVSSRVCCVVARPSWDRHCCASGDVSVVWWQKKTSRICADSKKVICNHRRSTLQDIHLHYGYNECERHLTNCKKYWKNFF